MDEYNKVQLMSIAANIIETRINNGLRKEADEIAREIEIIYRKMAELIECGPK